MEWHWRSFGTYIQVYSSTRIDEYTTPIVYRTTCPHQVPTCHTRIHMYITADLEFPLNKTVIKSQEKRKENISTTLFNTTTTTKGH